MLTFKPLDVYDVVDPDESLVEALREYPELREFEDFLIEDEEDAILPVGKANYRAIREAGQRANLAKQDNPALREALSDYPKPKASKKTKKPKASKAKPREESPKGIWDKLDLL